MKRTNFLKGLVLGVIAPIFLIAGAAIIIIHPHFDAVEKLGHYLIVAALLLCIGSWFIIWRKAKIEQKKSRRTRGRPFDIGP